MGRYNGNAGGSYGAAQQVINTVVTAGEPIQRGDLILVGADNKGYAAAMPSDSALAQTLRPTAGGPAVTNYTLAADVAAATANSGSGAETWEMVKLTNGNILVAYLDSNKVPGFTIYNQDGVALVSQRAVTGLNGAANGSNAAAVALPNGGFAIAFQTANGQYLAVYDSAGVQNLVPFLVGPTSVSGIRIALLSNGNIVIVSMGTNAAFSIYRTDGVQVKASTAVATNSYNSTGDRSISVAALVGGGFVFAYVMGNGTSSCGAYARQYDNTGTAVTGNAATLFTTGSGINGFCYAVALTLGGYAVAGVGNNVGAFLSIFNAQGVTQGGSPINLGRLANEIYGNFMSLAAAPNGNLGACYSTTGTAPYGLTAALYGPAGNVVAAPRLIETSGVAANSASITFNDDNSAYAVTCSGSNFAKVFALNSALAVTNTWTSAYSMPTYPRAVALAVTNSKVSGLPCYMLIVQTGGAGYPINMQTNLSMRQALTLIGTANNGAAKDGAVGVQLTGTTTLRRAFLQGWATNQQGANPPGQRMYAVGTTAVLSGIQPAAQNPIN